MNLPIAPLAAVVLGAATAAAVALMPAPVLEGLVMDSGIPAVVAAAEPPLGTTARAAIALGAGGLAALFTWFAAFLLLGTRGVTVAKAAPGEADEFESVPVPVLRRADAHPDAPPRPPLLATRDLGTPFLEVVARARATETAPAEPLPLPLSASPTVKLRPVPAPPAVEEVEDLARFAISAPKADVVEVPAPLTAALVRRKADEAEPLAPIRSEVDEVEARGPIRREVDEVEARAPIRGEVDEVEARGPIRGEVDEVEARAPIRGEVDEVETRAPIRGEVDEVEAPAPIRREVEEVGAPAPIRREVEAVEAPKPLRREVAEIGAPLPISRGVEEAKAPAPRRAGPDPLQRQAEALARLAQPLDPEPAPRRMVLPPEPQVMQDLNPRPRPDPTPAPAKPRIVLPAEQPLPEDLDQPLAAFDPQAIPQIPMPPSVPVAPLQRTRPAVFDASERFEIFELTPPVRPAPRPAPAPAPATREDAITAPETEATIHALLERLERGVVRRELDKAPEPPRRRDAERGLEEALVTLRNLARRA